MEAIPLSRYRSSASATSSTVQTPSPRSSAEALDFEMHPHRPPYSKRLALYSCVALFFISSLGRTLCETPLLRILELTVCRSYYTNHDPNAVGPDGYVDEGLCKIVSVQKELALLNGWNTFFIAFVGFFTAFPYAYLGERIDRRFIIFANLLSWLFSMVYVMCVYYFYETFNVKMIWLACLFSVIGGGDSVMVSLVNAMIAETVSSADLSKTFYLISALKMLAHVLGQSGGARLMEENLWLPLSIGFLVYTSSIPILALMVEPRHHRADGFGRTQEIDPTDAYSSHPDSALYEPLIGEQTMKSEKKAFFTRLRKALGGSLSIFTDLCRDRQATICLAIFFLNMLGHGVNDIVQQWASKGFGWSLAQANYLLSFERLVAGSVLFTLPVIVQVMKKRGISASSIDLRVLYVSLATTILGVICVGLSRSKGLVIASLAIYTTGFGFHDALQSYVTGISPKEYITRLYIGISVAERVGSLIGGPLWAALFSLGLRIGGIGYGLPFWSSSLIFIVVGMLLVSLIRAGGQAPIIMMYTTHRV